MAASKDHRYEPGDGPRDRSLRVGDHERNSVADILRDRHLEGRLTADEFQTRLECCLAAKTYAELDELTADFPRDGAERPRVRRPWPLPMLFVPVVLIAVFASGGHLVWLAIPLFFFFVVRPLMWRSWGGYRRSWPACGPRRPTRWTESH